MPEQPEYLYWDSCMFLYYLEGDQRRLLAIEDVLSEVTSSKGAIEIITSSFTMAEVAYVTEERRSQRLIPGFDDRLDKLWNDASMFKIVEFHQGIALDARSLIRKVLPKSPGLKPKDAVHIATAMSMGASEFHTYDRGLFKYSNDAGLRICYPEPRVATVFSGSYYIPGCGWKGCCELPRG